MNPSRSQTLAQYNRALNTFAKRKPLPSLPAELPGLRNLLNSMNDYSPHTRSPHVEDWNPFSQLPLFEIEPPQNHGLDGEFNRVIEPVRRYITVGHEAMHVLMWEPFFTGHLVPRAKQFAPWSLAFEGFCFWAADVLLNPKIKLRDPDGQWTMSRQSVSESLYHPRRAFEDLGLSTPDSILQVYLNSFGGFVSPLSRTKKSIPLSLANRAYAFYDSTTKTPRQMFDNFERIGLFDSFFRRFCAVPNIPTLLPHSLLSMDLAGDVHAYCQAMPRRGFAFIDRLDPHVVLRVRTRRSLQTRAYFAYGLHYLLRNGLVLHKKPFSLQAATRRIETYMDGLESLLAKLCAGQKPQSLTSELRQLDLAYSRTLRAQLIASEVKVGRRESILPVMPGHSIFQPGEDRSHLSLKNLLLFAQALAQQALALENAEILPLIHAVVGSVNRCKGKFKKTARVQLSRDIDALIAHPAYVEKWSLPLSSFDPLHGSFRDFLFIYI